MKHLRIFVLLAVLMALLMPYTVHAAPLGDDRVVMGGSFVLRRDETHNGNLIVIGGTAKIEKDAVVNGSIILVGGQVTIDGIIEGSLTLFGGSASLHDSAIILGDVYVTSSVLNKDELAQIRGEVIEGKQLPPGFTIPEQVTVNQNPAQGALSKVTDFLQSLLTIFFFSLVSASVAIIATLFMPAPVERVAKSIVNFPVISFGAAILTVIALPFLLVGLSITLILIPIAVLLILAFALASYMGWVSLGTEIGKRIADLFKTTWAVPVSAGMGTLILSLILGVITLIPCGGWLVVSIVVLIGLGGVILTRFGTRIYTYTGTLFNPKTTENPASTGPSDTNTPAA
jgi:hypothetical protein